MYDKNEIATKYLRILDQQTGSLVGTFDFLSQEVPRDSIFEAICMLDRCKNSGTIFTTGIGKSSFVSQKMASSLRSVSISSYYLDPVSALHGDLGVVTPKDIIVFITNSGSSNEIIDLFLYSRKLCPSLFIVGRNKMEDEDLERLRTVMNFEENQPTTVLLTGKVEEQGPLDLFPTTSTLSQMMICDALVLSLIEDFTMKDFFKNHPGGYIGGQIGP